MEVQYISTIQGDKIQDILPKISQLIYRDSPRLPPILNKQYNVIGFDADHCVVKYHVPALIQHIGKVQGRYMIQNFGYPEEYVQFTDEELNFPQNCTILDKQTGVIMKLGEGREILRACYGFQRLTQKQIAQIYGPQCKLQKYDPLIYKNADFNVFMGYFESGMQLLYSKAIEFKKSEKINYGHSVIWQQIRECVNNNWGLVDYQNKKVHSITQFGLFFPQIAANPEKYIKPSPQYRELVKELRARGIKTFLATNSHYEYSQLIMTTSFGPDWKDYFDVICIYAQKPIFFNEPKAFFREANVEDPRFEGKKVAALQKGKEYLYGNIQEIQNFFEKQFNTKSDQLKYLFVGDNYTTDCRAAMLNKNWQSLAIVQQIQEQLDATQLVQIQPLPKYQSVWGEYFYQKTSKGLIRNIWMKYLEQNSRYAVPLINWMKHLIAE